MTIKTKKYKLPSKVYIRLALKNVLRQQWWSVLIALAIASLSFILGSAWFWIIALILYVLYLLFWMIQFTGVTQLPQSKILFEKLAYEIDSRQVLIKINTKQGMPIRWDMVKRVRKGKDYFLLVISKAQLIHLPFRIFQTENEVKLMETLLKRKNLL